jgi:hypothetical protein
MDRMKRVVRSQATGCAVLSLLSVPLARSLPATSSAMPTVVRPPLVPAARRPFEAALGEARRCWTQAKIAANEERGTLETWDPAGMAVLDAEAWRRSTLRSDPGGYLREALAAAQRAAAMARTPDDAGRAAEMRALLAYGAGDDAEGLRQAWLLVAMRPRCPRSWSVLRCAARRAGPLSSTDKISETAK